MKPKLGRKVYCVYGDGIFVDTVGYLGKDSFIVSSVSPCTNSDSWEWSYDSYEIDWFTSISKAKKELLSHYIDNNPNLKVVKVTNDWYELAEKGEK